MPRGEKRKINTTPNGRLGFACMWASVEMEKGANRAAGVVAVTGNHDGGVLQIEGGGARGRMGARGGVCGGGGS